MGRPSMFLPGKLAERGASRPLRPTRRAGPTWPPDMCGKVQPKPAGKHAITTGVHGFAPGVPGIPESHSGQSLRGTALTEAVWDQGTWACRSSLKEQNHAHASLPDLTRECIHTKRARRPTFYSCHRSRDWLQSSLTPFGASDDFVKSKGPCPCPSLQSSPALTFSSLTFSELPAITQHPLA